jgi:Na+/melibiose symporter-like transporter
MNNYDLEFKIERTVRMKEVYITLRTIIAGLGSFTIIVGFVVMSALFTQAHYAEAMNAAWVTIITGVVTTLALLTLFCLYVHERVQEVHLKLQYHILREQAMHKVKSLLDSDIVE